MSAVFTTFADSLSFNDGSIDFNVGDGFVDIVPADCNCTGECVVYEEDDQFECLCSNNTLLAPDQFGCLCPNNTFLAPGQFDCFKTILQDISEITVQPDTTQSGFNITVYSLGTTVQLYSMEATLSGVTSDSNGEQSCAIVFFSEETDSEGNALFLSSNAIRNDDEGTVTTLSRVGVTPSEYVNTLDPPFLVGGAVLLSTSGCVIEDMRIRMNTSILFFSEEPNLTPEHFANILQQLNDVDASRNILQLPPTPPTLPPSTEMNSGAIAGIVVGGLIVIMLILSSLFLIYIAFIWKRKTTINSDEKARANHRSPSITFTAAFQNQQAQDDEEAARHSCKNIGFKKEENGGYTEIAFSPQFASPTVRSHFINKVSESFSIPRCFLNVTGEIGQGEYGIVYRAILNSKQVVAVKTLKGIYSQELVDSMLQECAKMQQFDHPNLVSLIGVCLDGGPTPLIVMPYMANGSLLGYLRKERARLVLTSAPDSEAEEKVFLAQKQLVDMCLQVVKGMEYLAFKKIVHRDLAARNCMIDFNFVIKVADFGLAEGMYSKTYFRRDEQQKKSEKLPLKWLAPECIGEGIFSEKTDVWSFGVTCWEVFSGGLRPYPGFDPHSLYEFLKNGHRMNKPENTACSDEMYAIMTVCWDADPRNRPDFSRLTGIISDSLHTMTDYLKLTLEESMSTVTSPFVDKVDQQFIVPRSCLDMTDIPLGAAGTFGSTFKATVRRNENLVEIVAVKMINESAASQDAVDALLKESARMQRFRHPNVMPLIGVCLGGGPTPLIVMPYMANGSLLDYLKKEKASLVLDTTADEESITIAQLRMTDMCLQVALGMEYLVSNGILHRGLAARNCMIDYNFVIKVSDFSCSENMYSKAYFRPVNRKSPLPLKWLAPDVFNNMIFSEKTDIWSYGVTCWEVFSSGQVPYSDVAAPSLLVTLLQEGHRLEKPANAACSDYAYSIMRQCWLATPEERPTFSELVTTISRLLRPAPLTEEPETSEL